MLQLQGDCGTPGLQPGQVLADGCARRGSGWPCARQPGGVQVDKAMTRRQIRRLGTRKARWSAPVSPRIRPSCPPRVFGREDSATLPSDHAQRLQPIHRQCAHSRRSV